MTPIRLKTTNASDYEPLRYDGQRLDELWSELEEALATIQKAPDFPLRERLTLAEPAAGPGGQIDWYGPKAETAQSPEQLQQNYRDLCNAIAAQLARHPSAAHDALAQALTIPDVQALHPGPMGPVLAPWGHRRRESKLNHGDLRNSENIAPPPRPPESKPGTPAQPAAAPESKTPPPSIASVTTVTEARRPLGPWQGWVLLLLGLLALAFFLWLLPYLAGQFAALRLWCQTPHLNLPWWVLLLLGLLLLLLAFYWPIKKHLVEIYDRRRARAIGASGGLLQVILAWNDRNDLDLHIICPDEGRIYYGAPEHPDGARLEHDANAAHSPLTTRPVESVVWHRHAQPGRYSVCVDPYNMRSTEKSAFRVTVIHKGRVILRQRSVARKNKRYGSVFNFIIPNA